MQKKRHWVKIIIRSLFIFLAIELIFIAYFTLNTNSQFKELIVNATTVKPETFTELYFEDHLNLPSEITPKNDYEFKFTIHNLENKDMEYSYEVFLDLGDEKLFIDKNVVSVKNGEYKTIEEKFRINDPAARTKIVVNLINKNQQLSFWVEGENK